MRKFKLHLLTISVLLLLFYGVAFAAGPVIDPTQDPSGAWNQLVGFARTNWWLAFAAGAYCLATLLAAAGAKFQSVSWLAWLGKGRVAIVLAGAAGTLSAGIDAYLNNGGNLTLALYAFGVALATYWHPAASDVAAARAAKAEKAAAKDKKPDGGFVARELQLGMAMFALVGMVMIAGDGCSLLGKDAKIMSGTFASCAEADFGAELKDAPAQLVSDLEAIGASLSWGELADIGALIKADGPELEADLAMVVAIIGIDALDCIISSIEAVINGGAGSSSAGSASPAGSGSAAPPDVASAPVLTPSKVQEGLSRSHKFVHDYRAARAKKAK